MRYVFKKIVAITLYYCYNEFNYKIQEVSSPFMGTDSIIQIIIMIVCVVFSAYFSATETAFTSLNRIRLKTMADTGNKKAKRTYALSEKYDKLISTVLIGNNIVNILLATVSTLFFVNNISKNFGATFSTIASTIVVLIFGEIGPKTISKEMPERFAMFSTPFIRMLMVLLTPINALFSAFKSCLTAMFKIGKSSGITEDELLIMVDEAEQDGELDEQESELIRSAIEFTEREASDILTPRVDVVAIDKTTQNGEIAKLFQQTGFSRLPVYDDTIDNIIGIIHQKDFHNSVYHKSNPLESIITPPIFISGSMKISTLLTVLQKEKSHLAVVADEYGGTEGIVTLEDILEELVGEIWDEHDDVVNEIEQIGEHTFKIMCSMSFEDFSEYFEIENDEDITTVGGWVMQQLSKIPDAGDSFVFENLDVTVTRVEDKRTVEIQIEQNEKQETVDED